jgi:hypothetical protein
VVEWYTRKLEVLVVARLWRFESSRPHQNGEIAQLVERRTENPCVPGSSPGLATINTFWGA